MSRAIFDQEHEAFREAVGTFLDKEVVPFHDQWERDGIVDREVWAKAGTAPAPTPEYSNPGALAPAREANWQFSAEPSAQAAV